MPGFDKDGGEGGERTFGDGGGSGRQALLGFTALRKSLSKHCRLSVSAASPSPRLRDAQSPHHLGEGELGAPVGREAGRSRALRSCPVHGGGLLLMPQPQVGFWNKPSCILYLGKQRGRALPCVAYPKAE